LRRLEETLRDECDRAYKERLRADAERGWVEQERACVSETMRGIAHTLVWLQQTLAGLSAEAREE